MSLDLDTIYNGISDYDCLRYIANIHSLNYYKKAKKQHTYSWNMINRDIEQLSTMMAFGFQYAFDAEKHNWIWYGDNDEEQEVGIDEFPYIPKPSYASVLVNRAKLIF
tara:strand:+ start:1168 stop:1491 length:324 start_codon:yes stop_codon:yes gene_type:complete